MRVALDSATDVGSRTARILLAEDSVTHLGFMQTLQGSAGRRSGPAGELSSYDVVVSDGTTRVDDLVEQTSSSGVPLVLWLDEPGLNRGQRSATVVAGANVGSALAPALARHPSAAITDSDSVTIAWTEPGSPQRRGTAVAFPDPVGVVWASERSPGKLVARQAGEWGGAVVLARGPQGERVVGVADHAAHLEALTLAAVALVAADHGYDELIQDASTRSSMVLAKAMGLELDIAVWRSA